MLSIFYISLSLSFLLYKEWTKTWAGRQLTRRQCCYFTNYVLEATVMRVHNTNHVHRRWFEEFASNGGSPYRGLGSCNGNRKGRVLRMGLQLNRIDITTAESSSVPSHLNYIRANFIKPKPAYKWESRFEECNFWLLRIISFARVPSLSSQDRNVLKMAVLYLFLQLIITHHLNISLTI